MRKVININIPKPCHEDWNKMTPVEKGKHCGSCKKIVFDFTRKSDEYIAKTFTENSNLCGRFNSKQLQRDLVHIRKEKNNYLSFLASGMFAILGLSSQISYSQGKPRVVQVDTTTQNIENQKSSQNSNLIHGTIIIEDKTPLAGANLLIKGSTKGTISNFDGEFSIEAKQGDIIQISYFGYKTKNIRIDKNIEYYTIILNEDKNALLENIVVGYSVINSHSEKVCTTKELEERVRKRKFARKNGAAFYKRKQKEHRLKIKNGEIERTAIGKLFYSFTKRFRTKT